MTPDPTRSWWRRFMFLREGSPYWWLHGALSLAAFACLLASWPTSFGVSVRALAAIGFVVFMCANLGVEALARRRHPEYFEKAKPVSDDP